MSGSSANVLWAHDTSLTTNPGTRQSWSQWRGYPEVTTTVGTTKTVTRFLRGLHGDKADSSGNLRSVTGSDLDGGTQTDFASYQGRPLDVVTYNGANVVSGQVSEYATGWTGVTQTGYFAGTSHFRLPQRHRPDQGPHRDHRRRLHPPQHPIRLQRSQPDPPTSPTWPTRTCPPTTRVPAPHM